MGLRTHRRTQLGQSGLETESFDGVAHGVVVVRLARGCEVEEGFGCFEQFFAGGREDRAVGHAHVVCPRQVDDLTGVPEFLDLRWNWEVVVITPRRLVLAVYHGYSSQEKNPSLGWGFWS